jgi:hypothetical protein
MNEKRWNILQYNIEWLRFSDTKASIILTVYGIIITIVYSNSVDVFQAISSSKFIQIICILSAISSLISIYFAFRCINPTLENKNPNSIIYFGHIADRFSNFDEYHQATKDIINNEERLSTQISEQIYTISKIAWQKYFNVTWSIRLFVLSKVILLIQVLIYLISNLYGS